jgi:hypothetical protein
MNRFASTIDRAIAARSCSCVGFAVTLPPIGGPSVVTSGIGCSAQSGGWLLSRSARMRAK